MGIDFAHMPLFRPVLEQDKKTPADYYVDANTGIACVIPSWRIMSVLEDEELVKQRKNDDDELAARSAARKGLG